MDFSGVGQKYFRRGTRNSKITFSPLETWKTILLQKIDGKMSNFKILGSRSPPLQTPMLLKLLLTKRLRKITKNIFTNKHMMILKIIITDIYFNILIFEPDTKYIEHKHTLSPQHRLICSLM